MFERLQKPFLTVETGEAYQPIRLTYTLHDKDQLTTFLNKLGCCEKTPHANSWNWFWRDECEGLQFESLDTYKKNPLHPLRLGTLTIRDDHFYISLPSFKRACLASQFFFGRIPVSVAEVRTADFINKVFGIDERLPHGFSELFKEDELDKIVRLRAIDYEKAQEEVANAESAEEALAILKAYTDREAQKRLPYAERYQFELQETDDPEIIFLSFYIYLRGRELVAIRRWFGETGYTLAHAADEAVEQVFGGVDIDILD